MLPRLSGALLWRPMPLQTLQTSTSGFLASSSAAQVPGERRDCAASGPINTLC